MRVTIHVVSAADYPILTEAVRRSRRELRSRVARGRDLDHDGWQGVTAIVTEALADGPRQRADLIQALDDEGFAKDIWEGVGLWVDMIRVPPSGTWERHRADLYGLASDHVTMSPIDESAVLGHLIGRYLRAFGPATIGDVSSWAGVSITTLRPVIEGMRLRRFRSEAEDVLLDLPRQPIPESGIPAPVRFLPTWDSTLLAHARRTQILPEEHRSAVFHTKNPQSVATFLVNGAVAGSWRQQGAKVVLDPFVPLPRAARRELDEESGQLEAFLTD
jgi:Winged helix DNA-binding domain